MIGSFKNFLVEEEKTVFFTWGRMNPPTIGHEKLLTALSRKAGNNPYFVYLSQSTDPKKNPLSYKDKIKIARKMFPRHARRIMLDAKIRNLFDILTKLYDMGYKNVTMVVGADRVQEFDILMNKYNGKKGKHGFYNFRSMNVASAGDRDPDAEGATGMSASKMRAAASKGDFTSFSQGLPKTFSNADAKNLFNTVRKGMGLKEQREYKNHIQLNPVSEAREQYVSGNLYDVGDKVIVKESDEVGEVTHLGANYVIVEKNGSQKRYWLESVELLEKTEVPQDQDIKDKKGTQPSKYYKGLSKSTKSARDAHFKKNTREPAPGDKEASKKDMPKSQHTLKFKQMYGEQDAVDRVKARIKRRNDRQDAKDEKQDKRDIRAIGQAKIRMIRKRMRQAK
mgnify:FL=1|tara:strand:- start:92 stop:1273 length:1182 start_codon:yes stop_codon:yes gene_type:complete